MMLYHNKKAGKNRINNGDIVIGFHMEKV